MSWPNLSQALVTSFSGLLRAVFPASPSDLHRPLFRAKYGFWECGLQSKHPKCPILDFASLGSQHPSPDVKNPLQFRTELLARNDHITRCQKCLFSRLPDIMYRNSFLHFLAEIWPKKITSRDGCQYHPGRNYYKIIP